MRYLETVILSPEPLLICGDFNIHVDVANNHDASAFLDILGSMALEEHVHFATHEHGHTLDLLITRSSDSVLLEKPSPGPFISDHCIVSCPLNISKPNPAKKLVSFRKSKSIDTEACKADLRTVYKPKLLAPQLTLTT